jgi:dihydroneopterin aldolase
MQLARIQGGLGKAAEMAPEIPMEPSEAVTRKKKGQGTPVSETGRGFIGNFPGEGGTRRPFMSLPGSAPSQWKENANAGPVTDVDMVAQGLNRGIVQPIASAGRAVGDYLMSEPSGPYSLIPKKKPTDLVKKEPAPVTATADPATATQQVNKSDPKKMTGPEMAEWYKTQNPEIRGSGPFITYNYKDPKTGKIIYTDRGERYKQGLTHAVPKDETAGSTANQKKLTTDGGDFASNVINGEAQTTVKYGGPVYADKTPFPQYERGPYLGVPTMTGDQHTDQAILEDMRGRNAEVNERSRQAAELARTGLTEAGAKERTAMTEAGAKERELIRVPAEQHEKEINQDLKINQQYQAAKHNNEISQNTTYEEYKDDVMDAIQGKEVAVTRNRIHEILDSINAEPDKAKRAKIFADLTKEEHEALMEYHKPAIQAAQGSPKTTAQKNPAAVTFENPTTQWVNY